MRNECPLPAIRDRVCALPVVRLSGRGDTELVYVPGAGVVLTLSAREVSALQACDRFETIERHAQGITARMGDESDQDWRLLATTLGKLRDKGVLRSESEVLEFGRGNRIGEDDPTITWITIPTSSRPNELLRAIMSYGAGCDKYRHDISFFIADGSPPDASAASRVFLQQQLPAALRSRTVYAGPAEKLGWCQALADDGEIPFDIASTAVMGFRGCKSTTGANRNAILLGTLGHLILSVDDDTEYESACFPETRHFELSINCSNDPTEIRLCRDRNTAKHQVEIQEIDVVASHKRLLGKTISQILAPTQRDQVSACNLREMCPHMLERAISNRGRILSTFNGMVGDSGMSSDLAFVLSRGLATGIVRGVGDEYSKVYRNREMARQSLSYVITHGPSRSPTMFCGLDNREMLPPFMPAYRNQDGIFAVTLQSCFQDACTGHVPFTLLHNPTGRRSYGHGDIEGIRLCDIIIGHVSSSCGDHMLTTPAARMELAGTYLMSLGKLPLAQFVDVTRRVLYRRAAEIIVIAEQRLRERQGWSGSWTADISARVRRLKVAIQRPAYCIPTDIGDGNSESALVAAQECVSQFGSVLYWWPRIVEKTRQVSRKGVSLGRAL